MAANLPVAFEATRDPIRSASRGMPLSLHAGRGVRLILFGVLWGIVVTGIEIPNLPFTTTAARPLSMLLVYQSLQWVVGGLLLSLALWWSARGEVYWLRLAILVPLAAAGNGVAMIANSVGFQWLYGYGVGDPILGHTAPPGSLFLYVGWLTLIYGGFAALIYALRRRIDQTTAALQGIALARERNEAAIADARLRALVERIEPRFLLEAMDTAHRQYGQQPARAEATLDACTKFLRSAMPQLRSGQSTVAAELDLVAAYLALRDCMNCREQGWRIDRGAASHDVLDSVALPPMALLPLLEQLVDRRSGDTGGDALAIDVLVDDASVAIRITAPYATSTSSSPSATVFDADWLAAFALRLTLVCGPTASIRSDGGADASATLVIVVPRPIHRH